MRVHEVKGSAETATLLRELADGIDRGVFDVEGRADSLSVVATAVLEMAGVAGEGLSLVAVRVFQRQTSAGGRA